MKVRVFFSLEPYQLVELGLSRVEEQYMYYLILVLPR